jgi:hypothetical protein
LGEGSTTTRIVRRSSAVGAVTKVEPVVIRADVRIAAPTAAEV